LADSPGAATERANELRRTRPGRELDTSPEIIEAHHVTGEDCFILKVLARSMRHLEEVAGRISGLGSVTTRVVYSSPLM